MRPLCATAAFLLVTVAYATTAQAHVPLWAPRVSLSLALDWNKVALEALSQPKPKPVARVARHQVPRLTVTGAAPAPAQLGLAAYNRVEGTARQLLMPHYVEPDAERREMFRQVYVMPYTPYLGAYGLVLTVETNALLR